MPSNDVILRNPHIYFRTGDGLSELGDSKKESDLHKKIIEYCKGRRWIYFHGSMAHRTHSTLGQPDFTVLANNGRVFFIECKTRTGKLSNEQRGLQLAADMLGHKIHIVRSFKEFVQLVSFESQASSCQ